MEGVAITIQGLKYEKAAGEDKIRLKMLYALNREGIVNMGVSGGVKIRKNTKRLADRCDHFNIQER